MEASVAASSSLLLFSTPRRSPVSFRISSLPCKNSSSRAKPQALRLTLGGGRKRSYRNTVKCSSSESPSEVPSERWIRKPIGDGDSSHIGYRVKRPGAFEIASDSVVVGRLPEDADIVLPVPTVSRVHARIEKKDGNLLVTDLESTNGTYLYETRLTPGVATAVDPGRLLIFGDTHLAMFRVLKIPAEAPGKANGAEEGGAKEEGAKEETQAEVSTVNEASSA